MEILWEKLVFHDNSHLYQKKNRLISLVKSQCDCFSTLTTLSSFQLASWANSIPLLPLCWLTDSTYYYCLSPASDSPSITTVPTGVRNDHFSTTATEYPPSLSRLFMFLPYWELSLLHYFIWFLANTSLAPALVCRGKKKKKKKTHLRFKEKGHMNGCQAWAGWKRNLYDITVQIRQENRKLLDIS